MIFNYTPLSAYVKKEEISYNLNYNYILDKKNCNYKSLKYFIKNYQNKFNKFNYIIHKMKQEEIKEIIYVLALSIILILFCIVGNKFGIINFENIKISKDVSRLIDFIINSYIAIIPYFAYITYTIFGDKTTNNFYGIRYGIIDSRIGTLNYSRIILLIFILFPLNLLFYILEWNEIIITTYVIIIISLLYFSYLYFKTRYSFNDKEKKKVKEILILNNFILFDMNNNKKQNNNNSYVKEYNSNIFLYIINNKEINVIESDELFELLSDLFFSIIFKCNRMFNYESEDNKLEYLFFDTVRDYFYYHHKALLEFWTRDDFYNFNKFAILYQENMIMLFHTLLQSDNVFLKDGIINFINNYNLNLKNNIEDCKKNGKFFELVKDIIKIEKIIEKKKKNKEDTIKTNIIRK